MPCNAVYHTNTVPVYWNNANPFLLGIYSRGTLAFVFKKCCSQTFPIAWDDPSDSSALQQILMDLFHQASRGTACNESYPTTVPLVSVNDKILKKDLRYVDGKK